MQNDSEGNLFLVVLMISGLFEKILWGLGSHYLYFAAMTCHDLNNKLKALCLPFHGSLKVIRRYPKALRDFMAIKDPKTLEKLRLMSKDIFYEQTMEYLAAVIFRKILSEGEKTSKQLIFLLAAILDLEQYRPTGNWFFSRRDKPMLLIRDGKRYGKKIILDNGEYESFYFSLSDGRRTVHFNPEGIRKDNCFLSIC